ncbi:hypothetical protein [Alcaligenes phenolicus]|uniref:DnrO protein n=1 Tax=Alcaligenes phenolicus TaxID=232846 RepID=A0AAW5VWM7_9BURK|nr:hypothetical protein [Alcaligenes phenolicus]MCX5565805.1 hypothetical protein [Alcaligenes phenolicus]
MKLPAHFISATLLAISLGTVTGTAIATDTTHHHGHETHGTMELNQGQKWQTDAALRQGMNALHQIVSVGLDGAHANGLKSDDYKKMSGEIMTQFTYIVENCDLEPEADAQLHILLGNIIQGVEVIEGKLPDEQPEDGLIKMAQALNGYGSYFEHPNWKSFDVSH